MAGSILGCFVYLVLVLTVSCQADDYTQYVDVFIGTDGGGDDFPGVSRPFGMVKLGPDILNGNNDAYSGYADTGNFSGFSLMHEQGTGGAPKYGTVAQLPLVGNISDPLSNITVGRNGTDQASVGYYNAWTNESVMVELAGTHRAGMFRYTFPSSDDTKNVLVDASHFLPDFRGSGLAQAYQGGNITVFNDGHYEGNGVYNNGWNRSPDWSIYFCKHSNFLFTSIARA
jgi:putative alpha-1,2-mannosidase